MSAPGSGVVVGGGQGVHVAGMQRRRLLLAIGEVLGDGGLEAGTVGRVCEQAGVSRRTFYELFEDREDCLLAAFDQAIDQIAQKLQPVYARKGRWRERIRDALTALLEHLDTEPDVARLCVVEAPRGSPKILERRRHALEVLAGAVDDGRSEARVGYAPPPLTAQGIVGGALSVIHARLLTPTPAGAGAQSMLIELTGPLMGMIVHPYLGPGAAKRELERPTPVAPSKLQSRGATDPFKGLPIRFTYRTARVLATIARDPGASNRHIADSSGIADEGQMSRLLERLRKYELIVNHSEGQARGEANAWTLTKRGTAIHQTIAINNQK
jgi:AcrR family transcriptional regulator